MAEPFPIYMALMAELERRRQKLRWPMWKLDDAAGVPDRYYSKALHADTPSGRVAGWLNIHCLASALYPRGVRVVLIPMKKRLPATASIVGRKRGVAGTTKSAPPPRPARFLLRSYLRAVAQQAGKARQAQLTKEERRELARFAARKRWEAGKQRPRRARKKERGRVQESNTEARA